MTDFLQQTPHLSYSLSLIELAVYRESPEKLGTFYIQPKILMRTKEITRAIVEIKIPASRSDVVVSLPSEPPDRPQPPRKTITEEEFLEELQQSSGDGAVNFAKWALEQAVDRKLRIDWKDAGPLLKYDDPETGEFFTLGQLNKSGFLTATSRLYRRFEKLGWPFDACIDYLDEVASLIPNAIRKSFQSKSGKKWQKIVHGENPASGSNPPFLLLEPKKTEWFDAIEKLKNRIIELAEENE